MTSDEKIKSVSRNSKKHTIMGRVGGYAHKEDIQQSLLMMMILGMIIGGASKEIISAIIVFIVDSIEVKTILIMTVLASISLFIVVVVIIIGFIGGVISSFIGGVIGILIGSFISEVISGIIGELISSEVIDDTNNVKEVLFIGGLLLTLFSVIFMFIIYYKRRRAYLDELIVADKLYKVRCQQWRIFHGLKSGEGKGWRFCWRQRWRIFWGLKAEGDIDHIIVCKKGVFCVETTTNGKNPNNDNKIVFKDNKILINNKPLKLDPLKQAHKNAEWLQGEINKTNCKPKEENFVIPILTCPGWSVHNVFNGKIVVCNSKQELEIVVCNPKRISGMLRKRNDILCDREVNNICRFLEKATEMDLFDNR